MSEMMINIMWIWLILITMAVVLSVYAIVKLMDAVYKIYGALAIKGIIHEGQENED